MDTFHVNRLCTAAAVLVSVLLIVPRPASSESPNGHRGGVLNVALEADFPTFDPLRMGALADREVAMSFYDTLLNIDEKGNLVPNLAESYTASDDLTSFDLKMRGGIKFHDGTLLDADAVVFNLKRLMDPKNHCRCTADVAVISTVEKIGPLEVRIHTKAPAAHFLAVLTDVAGIMASPTALQKSGADYGMNPVGTGPFVFKEWKKGNYLEAVRNPSYWKKGKPFLDKVFYRPIPDEQVRMSSLRAGNVDVMLVPGPKDVAEAENAKNLQVIDAGSLGTVFVMFNAKNGPTADVRVRRALAYATNRPLLNKVINHDVYKVANTPFGSGLSPHEKVDGYPNYDLKKSQELLEAVGKPVNITLSVQLGPLALQTGQVLQQMWKRAGVNVEIKQFEQVQHIQNAISNQFEASLFRWPGRADPDLNVYQFFKSDSPRNYARFSDPKMDQLLEKARRTTDPAQRDVVYKSISDLLTQQMPYLFLNYYTSYMLATPKVHGIQKVPDGLLRVDSVWKD
ncbi:ABC transporter substrate-binding protein [Noviherbaspirillum pedocola]|uniref:Solute-binding protein family 5 domain-containing protein n=1 Tax=Noviherbaspirillum pedocola TaxID=2801341 RepID=A0A934W573_9BURK|nr:ABC transporter substrate-binding protein [Noviherbaspirillum pedocola]MBK4739316.1 hypothetical protein [Noviherbaspirillum pedocola]